MRKEIALDSMKDTELLGSKLAEYLKSPVTVGLVGELGAGKTTLTKSILKGLNYNEPVSSPTFVLQHQYDLTAQVVSHWDLYRLDYPPEELLQERASNEIVIIEWADKFQSILQTCDLVAGIEVTINPQDSLSLLRRCIISGRLSEDFCRYLWAKD